jgi:hypothetical protein
MLNAYVEAALFFTTDDKENPLCKNYGIEDLAPETLEAMKRDCEAFEEKAKQYIIDDNLLVSIDNSKPKELAGHDFWLTRNGEGAGFWDGNWVREAGQALTEISKEFGEFNLYVGDDKKIYHM